MFIYLITFLWTILSLKYFCDRKNSKRKVWGFTIGLSLPVLIAGLRDIGIGTDTLVYTEYYWKESAHYSLMDILSPTADFEGIDRGYMLINMLGRLFSDDVWMSLFISSIFTFFFFFHGLNNLKCKLNFKFWIFAFYFLFVYYNQSLNYMRQFCALALVFCAYSYYLRNNYFICLCLFLSALFFHSSSLFFVLIPALIWFANLKSKKLRFFIGLGIIVFFLSLLFFFWKILSFMVEYGLIAHVYGDRYGSGTEYKPQQIDYSNILSYVISFLLIIYARFKHILKGNKYSFVMIIHVVYGLTYSLMTISGYLFRISYYLGIIDMLYIVVVLSSKRMPKFILISYFIMLFICWFYYFIYNNSCETYPYKSTILGIV